MSAATHAHLMSLITLLSFVTAGVALMIGAALALYYRLTDRLSERAGAQSSRAALLISRFRGQ